MLQFAYHIVMVPFFQRKGPGFCSLLTTVPVNTSNLSDRCRSSAITTSNLSNTIPRHQAAVGLRGTLTRGGGGPGLPLVGGGRGNDRTAPTIYGIQVPAAVDRADLDLQTQQQSESLSGVLEIKLDGGDLIRCGSISFR